jgi:hypothetical protein
MGNLQNAISISRLVHDLLSASTCGTTHVLASFPQVCNLLMPDGEVIALVSSSVGDGPLNIVVDASFHLIDQAAFMCYDGRNLRIGSLSVALDGATIWEPIPDWVELAARQCQIHARLTELKLLALRLAPQESLLATITGLTTAEPGSPQSAQPHVDLITQRIHKAAVALAAGWVGVRPQLQRGAKQVAGLGSGLTPAGDDFLAGIMLWSWLAHPDPRDFCRELIDAVVSRTTTLSAALLRAAASGACNDAWHHLLACLASGARLESAVQRVLSHGATSGADTLAGFLWIEGAR